MTTADLSPDLTLAVVLVVVLPFLLLHAWRMHRAARWSL